MNRQPFEKPPRWWSPKLSKRWVDFWRPFRKLERQRTHRLLEVEVRGAEYIRNLLGEGHGVLITPNHCSHADGLSLYEAADRVGVPIYAIMAWQVFARGGWLKQQILRQHGAFSIDRDGTDLSALRKAREVLQHEPYPLAIFPEGEVYHLNERLTPFREGPAAIALMSARKGLSPNRMRSVRDAVLLRSRSNTRIDALDKFEEDLLGVQTATIRGARRAVVAFGEPVIVPAAGKHDITPPALTQTLHERVATLLGSAR